MPQNVKWSILDVDIFQLELLKYIKKYIIIIPKNECI